jgi:predicted RNase H-like HicB family nuclease
LRRRETAVRSRAARGDVVALTIRLHEEDGQFLALCEELGVETFGDTQDEALAAIREAVLLYLNTLETEGERERVFKERGIKPVSKRDLRSQTISVTAHIGEVVMPSAFPLGRVATATGA